MDFYRPETGPPKPFSRENKIYEIMGEDNIKEMIKDFYIELGKSKISYMFPKDLVEASKKSADFFIFLLGGPPIYHQKYGPPMMRKRHLRFEIDEEARLEWLRCFKKIFESADQKYHFPKEHKPDFLKFLDHFSQWMVNKK